MANHDSHSHHGALFTPSLDSPRESYEVDHRGHVNEFINEINERGENELLEMLHVPILHGGFKEVLLFETLSISTPGAFFVACLLLVFFVFLLELLRYFSTWTEGQYSGNSSPKASICDCKHCNSLTANVKGVVERQQYDAIHDARTSEHGSSPSVENVSHTKKRWFIWCGVGGLQFLLYIFSTFLMLIAMTMNIYLIVSMGIGSAIGKMTVMWVKKKRSESNT